MATIKEYKYKYIKNLFSKEELSILKKYCKNKLNENWQTDFQSPLAPCWRKDSLMNAMLEQKLPLIEKETGLNLLKTYSFWRYYVYGSILKNHTDRASCEISVTACIHKSHNWPIHIEDNWIEMEEGDGVIYLGVELEHGRKPFKGDGCAQVFMHYVDRDGPFSRFANDPDKLVEEAKKAAEEYQKNKK